MAPSSQVEPLPAETTGSVEVTWGGEDAAGGSGIASYDVYVAKDAGPYELWQIAATTTQASFTGLPGAGYRFYSVARDAAGNTEAAPSAPDANTKMAGGGTFATWIVAQGVPANARGPADDADLDGLANFAEYAHALNPLHPDAQLAAPQAAIVQIGGSRYVALNYRRPKVEPADVQYRVTASSLLSPWAGTSAVTTVGSPVDRGSYVEVTVRSTQPVAGNAQGFLRLQIAR